MKKIHKKVSGTGSLRKKAEEKLADSPFIETGFLAEGDAVRLIHELKVHQVELEMQNEELRMAIDQVEVAAEKITLLYDFAPTAYFTLDDDCSIINLNFNGAKMLGKKRSNLISSNFYHFIGQDERDTFSEFFNKIRETNSKQTCEIRFKIQDNPSIFVYLEGVVAENLKNYLISAFDITERRRLDETLKENEIRLQELNATKDKFFSIIGHDLRGPFTAIIGFSDLLIEQMKSKNYKGISNYAEYIRESSHRAMDLLKNLLEWAYVQTGKIKFQPRNIELLEIVNEVTELLKYSAQQKSIAFSMDFPRNIIVYADKEMISNVLRNLVSNAIKFTSPGGKVTISAQQNQNELMMIVSDNGVGIKKDSFEKLFQIEVNQSTRGTRNEEGTGLGLILCKEFITMHGGEIWAESEPDKGSKFYFTIPLKP